MLFEKIKLEDNEEVLATVRKHWFVITMELLATVVLLPLPLILLLVASALPENMASASAFLFSNIVVYTFFSCVWILLLLLTSFAVWTHYYLDLWVVTDRRIILVDQIRFFSRNVSVFRLERMQDIEYKVKGIIPTLLNFGTLKAQTAGAHESNFNSTGLPDPRGLQALIQQAMDARMRELHIAPDELNH